MFAKSRLDHSKAGLILAQGPQHSLLTAKRYQSDLFEHSKCSVFHVLVILRHTGIYNYERKEKSAHLAGKKKQICKAIFWATEHWHYGQPCARLSVACEWVDRWT